MWTDAIMIMMSCVSANHLGLVEQVEKVVRHTIPIVNCSKCFSFWTTLLYCLVVTHDVVISIFVSFCMAFLSFWFDIVLGILDNLYYKAYERTYGTESTESDDEVKTAKDYHNKDAKNEMPEMWWVEQE